MTQHNPKTSTAYIIRYHLKDPSQNEIVKRVKGQDEALKWLDKLTAEEKEPNKYRFLWQWKDRPAALEYDLKQLT